VPFCAVPGPNDGNRRASLLVGWLAGEECKVVYVPFDADWCRQMVVMLASVIAAAIPLCGQRPPFFELPGHDEFVQCTKERSSVLKELCSVGSVKEAVHACWL